MVMKVYKKLVRDKIPEIIISKGDAAVTRILTDEEYSEHLTKKLYEEVQEYLTNGTIEELVDIYEVLLAILNYRNVTFESFEKLRKKKLLEKGGFSQKIFLDLVVSQEKNEVGDNNDM